MSQPPMWGSLPAAPPSRQGELRPSRTGDVAAAWILWALLLVGCFVVWLIMVIVGVGFGIGCSGDPTYDSICVGSAADVAQTGYFGTWFVMALAVLFSLGMTILQTIRRRLAWIWPAIGIAMVVASFMIWWLAYAIAA